MKHILVFGVLITALAVPAYGQQGTASIRGVVTDEQRAVLPGVVVIARDQDTGNFAKPSATRTAPTS